MTQFHITKTSFALSGRLISYLYLGVNKVRSLRITIFHRTRSKIHSLIHQFFAFILQYAAFRNSSIVCSPFYRLCTHTHTHTHTHIYYIVSNSEQFVIAKRANFSLSQLRYIRFISWLLRRVTATHHMVEKRKTDLPWKIFLESQLTIIRSARENTTISLPVYPRLWCLPIYANRICRESSHPLWEERHS